MIHVMRLIDATEAGRLADAVEKDPPPRVNYDGPDWAQSCRVGDAKYAAGLSIATDLEYLYQKSRDYSEVLIGEGVRTSPFHRSSISVKIYEPGDHQTWHWDTNTVSALLTLCGDPHPGRDAPGTEVDLGGAQNNIVRLRVEPGEMVVFRGDLMPHQASPVGPQGENRCIVSFNLYLTSRVPVRPEGLDHEIYGF